MKSVLVLLVSAILLAGCGTYTITTDDIKEGGKRIFSGDFGGPLVASATIQAGNTVTVPIALISYSFGVTMKPSDTLRVGGSLRLGYQKWGRSNYHNRNKVEIAVVPIGDNLLKSAKIDWSFSQSSWDGSENRVFIIEQNRDGLYIR
ncbi:MAG: hypothetical protein AAB432_01205 [Patescibacteria group bacterium]